MIPQTPLGNVSTKKAPGMQHKRWFRMERIARLELGGATEAEIAFNQRISVVRVNQIKRTPEYIALRMQLAHGIISQDQRVLLESVDEQREVLRDMVPDALVALRDALLDKSNPALRFKAATDLLDREGALAKVSKTEVKLEKTFDFAEHEKVTNDLMAVLKSNDRRPKAEEFAGDIKIDDLGVEEFARTAKDDDQQKQLQKSYEMINSFIETDPTATIN